MPARKATATARKRKAPAKRTNTRRSTAKRATAKPPPVPLTVATGEYLFVLDVPFEDRQFARASGAVWDPHHRTNVFIGRALPQPLRAYRPQRYSQGAHLEARLNTTPPPDTTAPGAAASKVVMRPRPHQTEAIHAIDAAARHGFRGFLCADDVGLGKTLSSLYGIYAALGEQQRANILIICPKGAIPHWRDTISAAGDRGHQIVVTNYEQTKKLLTVPAAAAAAKKTRTKNRHIATGGVPLVAWDAVIVDEAHYLKNPDSQRTQAVRRVARYAATAPAPAPFVVWLSATAGQTPIELGYLEPILTRLTGASRRDFSDFGQWLCDEGYQVTYDKRFKKWVWGAVPEGATEAETAAIASAKAADLRRVHELLFALGAPAIRRLPQDIAGWPEMNRIAVPVDLTFQQRALYAAAWNEFRAALHLAVRGRDPVGARAATTRFRQKASLIRVPGTVDQVVGLLENGRQVAVSVEYHESKDSLREALEAAGYDCAEFSGRNTAEREAERIRFQRGTVPVMLFTVVEAISLHAGQQLPDGSVSSLTPRATVVHDPRYSGIQGLQVEGRCHRDGQSATVFYPFAVGTVEEKIVQTLLTRVLSTKAMMGDDVTSVEMLLSTLQDEALNASDVLVQGPPPPATPLAPPTGSAVGGWEAGMRHRD